MAGGFEFDGHRSKVNNDKLIKRKHSFRKRKDKNYFDASNLSNESKAFGDYQ